MQVGLAGILPYSRMVHDGIEWDLGAAICGALKLLVTEDMFFHNLQSSSHFNLNHLLLLRGLQNEGIS